MYCDIPLLGRCCFCLPLRKGVLVFGLINAIFCLAAIAIYSYCLHIEYDGYSGTLLYHGGIFDALSHICLVIYLVELLMNIMLMYATCQRNVFLLKVYYYYMLTTTAATVVLQLANLHYQTFVEFEMLAIGASGLFLQIYLIILVRSLLKKLEDRQGPVPCQLQGLSPTLPSQVYSPTTEVHIDLLA